MKKYHKPNVIRSRKINNQLSLLVKNKHFLFIFSAIIISIIIYIPSLKNGFVFNWDDDLQVVNNPDILSLNIEHIFKIFSSFYVSMYQPIPTLSFAVEYYFFGINPRVIHTTSLIIHLINVILVYWLFYKLSKKKEIAFIIILIFALHPLNVESVCWVSTRSNLLYSLFFISALISYLYYIDNTKNFEYLLLSFLLFSLSIFSKISAITFPLLILLFDYYYSRKNIFKIIIEKLPFFILAILFGLIAINTKLDEGIRMDLIPKVSPVNAFFIANYMLVLYVYKLFFPVNLNNVYFYPQIINGLLPLQFYLSPILIIISGFLIYFFKRFRKVLIFGTMFFLINISIVLQFINYSFQIITERYAYISFLGFFFIIAYFIIYIKENYMKKSYLWKKYLFPLFVFYLLFCTIISYNRTKVWKDAVVLFTDLIKKNPDKYFGYLKRGDARAFNRDYDGAIEDYNKVISMKPFMYDAFINRGNAFCYLGKYDKAIDDFSNSLKIKYNNVEAFNSRGNVRLITGDYENAISDFNNAINFKPDLPEAYNNRGIAKYYLKDTIGACNDWNRSYELGHNMALKMIKKYCYH